jgi:hypothetical protein
MNPHHTSLAIGRKALSVSAALLGLGFAAVTTQAQNTPVNLLDGNSSALVDVNSSMGMYNWSVSGQNQLNQQWFFYRVGSGAQQSIDQISPANYTQTNASSLNTVYGNSSYAVSINYRLKDGGVGQSDMNEDISIKNNNLTGSINFTFFQYSDFNLNGTPNGDEVYMDNTEAYQVKGLTAILEGIIEPDADYYEANTTGGPTSTLYKLANNSNMQLDDNGYASGDVTWAFEWDLTIAAGQTVDILKDKQLQVILVPEPSVLALVALGLGAWGVGRRRTI